LAAEGLELRLRDPSLEERPAVEPGRGMTLEEDQVAGVAVLAAEEVVEADLVEAGARGVRRQVPAQPREPLARAQHHHRRIPPDDAADAQLHLLVAGERRLLLGRDGVDVARLDDSGETDAELSRALEDLAQNEVGALRAHVARDVV